eukprot:gene8801-749_t
MKNTKLPKQFIEQMLTELKDDKDWKFVKETGGIKVFQKLTQFHTSLLATKVRKIFKNCKTESLNQLLHEKMIERHGEWNNTYVGGKYVETFDENHNVQYWEYSLGGLVSNRDFLVERKRMTLEDGTIVMIDASTDYKSDEVTKKNNIRCDLPFNVRAMKQAGDDVEYSYMNLTDIKGLFPYFLINLGNTKISVEETQHVEEACKNE